MEWITSHWTDILQIIVGMLGVFSIIARLTPTTADDKVTEYLLKIIHLLGLTRPEAKK